QVLLDHHDALRLRLVPDPSSDVALEIAPPGTIEARNCFRRVDIRELDGAGLQAGLTVEAESAERRLAPAAGIMLQAVWFDAGGERSGRLLLVIHHLAVDGVSWRILVHDLATVWSAIANGRDLDLPPRGTSFRRWAHRLVAAAQEPARRRELS